MKNRIKFITLIFFAAITILACSLSDVTGGDLPAITITPPISLENPPDLSAITPQVTLENVEKITEYDAALLISSFASQYLGINVDVARAAGRSGDLTIPSVGQSKMDETVSVAGQASAGAITLTGDTPTPGFAEVAIGEGVITGDLDVDLNGASQGAFVFILKEVPPQSETEALETLYSIFPTLIDVDLEPKEGTQQQGYVFISKSVEEGGVDLGSAEVSVTGQGVLAGVNSQGAATIAWIIWANGEFAKDFIP